MNFSTADLGDHIQSARKSRGLTQKELADRSGIGKTAMFDLEHGNPGVRLNTLLAVLEQLNMDLSLHDPDEGSTVPLSPPSHLESLPEHLL